MNKINPKPVTDYTPPAIPTLAEVKEDSTFLKRLPRRWKKSAAVLAIVGMVANVGVWSPTRPSEASVTTHIPPVDNWRTNLSIRRDVEGGLCCNTCRVTRRFNYTNRVETFLAYCGCWDYHTVERRAPSKRDGGICPNAFRIYSGWDECDDCYYDDDGYLCEFCDEWHYDDEDCGHYGGSGMAIYITRLTEQEALGVVQRRLEEVGLEFGEAPDLPYAPLCWWCESRQPRENCSNCRWYRGFTNIRLFDEERNIAIAMLHHGREIEGYDAICCGYAEDVSESLTRQSQESGSNITFGAFTNPMLCDESWWNSSAARAQAERQLLRQVQAFIVLLYEQGVIDLPEPPEPSGYCCD